MAEINPRIFIMAPAHILFKALSTRDGLTSWWTSDVTAIQDGKAWVFGSGTTEFSSIWRLFRRLPISW